MVNCPICGILNPDIPEDADYNEKLCFPCYLDWEDNTFAEFYDE